MIGGCASTHTVARIGLGYDVTDYVHGCRLGYSGCGSYETREIANFEVLWAPSIKPGPYAGISHRSHYSRGAPFNNKPEDFGDSIVGGWFIQFGNRDGSGN